MSVGAVIELVHVSIEIAKASVELGIEVHKEYVKWKEARRKQKQKEASSSSKTTSTSSAAGGAATGGTASQVTDDNGTVFTGSFVDDDLEGEGTMTSATKEYSGMFRSGVFHGEGELKYKKTKAKYCGVFKDGLYHGSGVYTTPGGWIFAGNFDRGDFVEGIILTSAGARFEGTCRGYKPVRGVYDMKNGYKYIGEFQDWKFHGFGKLIYPIRAFDTGKLTIASYYEGQLNCGKFNGIGEMEWRNGRRWAGRWVDSTMVKAEGRYLDAGEVFSSSDCGNSGGAAAGCADLATLVPAPPASGGGSGGMEATSVEANSEGGAASP